MEQPLRIGCFAAFVGPAVILAVLINYGFGKIDASLAPWKSMFLFAGAITTVWGLLIPFILPADPISARSLTARERYIAVARIRSNNAGVRNTHVKFEQVKETLTDLKFWLCFFFTVFALIVNGPTSSFVPIIINGFGYSTFESLLLNIPTGAVTFAQILGISYLAMRKPMWRCWISIACQFVSTLSALLLWLLPLSDRAGLLFGCFTIGCGIPGYIIMLSTQLANTAGYTKRATSSAGIYVAYCIGNIIGPLVFREQDAPRYKVGFIVVVASTLAAVLLLLAYRLVCLAENRKRDRAGFMESFEHAYEDDVTDLKVSFSAEGRITVLLKATLAHNRHDRTLISDIWFRMLVSMLTRQPRRVARLPRSVRYGVQSPCVLGISKTCRPIYVPYRCVLISEQTNQKSNLSPSVAMPRTRISHPLAYFGSIACRRLYCTSCGERTPLSSAHPKCCRQCAWEARLRDMCSYCCCCHWSGDSGQLQLCQGVPQAWQNSAPQWHPIYVQQVSINHQIKRRKALRLYKVLP